MKKLKFIIIGLGHFGAALAEKLTIIGHEVVGVDKVMDKVDLLKDKITHTICLNCKDPESVKSLPLKNADIVIVCIGEDEGENIMTTAILKGMNVKRLISRSVSPLHENVLEAMGVVEIVRPEIETAERWAVKLSSSGYLNLFEVTNEHIIVETIIPSKFAGLTIEEAGFSRDYKILVLAKLILVNEKNFLGVQSSVLKVAELVTASTILEEDDIVVIFGHKNDVKKILKE